MANLDKYRKMLEQEFDFIIENYDDLFCGDGSINVAIFNPKSLSFWVGHVSAENFACSINTIMNSQGDIYNGTK